MQNVISFKMGLKSMNNNQLKQRYLNVACSYVDFKEQRMTLIKLELIERGQLL